MKQNQSVFKNIIIGFICFFFTVQFFCLFFSSFLGLIGFSVFLLTPNGRATKPKDIGFNCLARPKIDGSGWAGRPNLFLKCFGSSSATPNSIGSCWAGGPNTIGSFWKCFGLGLAATPNNIGSWYQASPTTFGREWNALGAILDQKYNRGTPFHVATVLSTVKTVYGYSVVHSAMCMCLLLCILKESNRE